MVKRKKIVITNNKEIYEKFNMLMFSNEVLLKDVKDIQIDRILKNVNKNSDVLQSERVGDYILVKKVGTVNFTVYHR